jgi:hypothetical protein
MYSDIRSVVIRQRSHNRKRYLLYGVGSAVLLVLLCIVALITGQVGLPSGSNNVANAAISGLAILLIAAPTFSLAVAVPGVLGIISPELWGRGDMRSEQIDYCRDYIGEHYSSKEQGQILLRASYHKDFTGQISLWLLGTVWAVVIALIAAKDLLLPDFSVIIVLFAVLNMPLLTYIVAERAATDGIIIASINESLYHEDELRTQHSLRRRRTRITSPPETSIGKYASGE